MEPRYCGACGTALNPPGAAFCFACGSPTGAGMIAPQAAPPQVAESPQAEPHPPAAILAVTPAAEQTPWSTDLQPGETSLGYWNANHTRPEGETITGKLIVTNRRILFDPMIEAYANMEVIDQASVDIMKRELSLVIDKDQLVDVRMEDGCAERRLRVWLASGASHSFGRGMMMSVNPIAAAIQQR